LPALPVREQKTANPRLIEAAETELVVVTGSYIPIPTAESEGPLPVAIYSQEQLIRFGSNTPAEGLRQLPSFVGSTENENNSALGTGSAQVNLRAFGSRNTVTIAFPRHNHVCAAHVRATLRTQFRRCLARDRRAAGRPNRRPRQRFHSLSFLEACASQHSRRAKNLRAFLGFEFGHAGLGKRTNQTKHARTRRHRTGEAKYGSGKPLRLGLFA